MNTFKTELNISIYGLKRRRNNAGLMQLIAILIIAFFVLPLVVLLAQVGEIDFNFGEAFFSSLAFSFNQAFLSASISVFLGYLGAIGLAGLSQKHQRLCLNFSILPNFLPVIYIIFCNFTLFSYMGWSAQGIWPIVICHGFLNIGLSSFYFVRIFKARLTKYQNLCLVEGVSRITWWKQSVGILKSEIALIFLVIFGFCFMSFAIPIVFAGVKATTIEVLIYQALRLRGDWSLALGYAFVQLVFLGVLYLIFVRPVFVSSKPYKDAKVYFSILQLSFIPVFVSLLLASLFCINVFALFKTVDWSQEFLSSLLPLAGQSLFMGYSVGVSVVLLLALVLMAAPNRILEKFVLAYVAPSTVLVGMGVVLIPWSLGGSDFIRLLYALILVFLPIVYRLFVYPLLTELNGQMRIAQTMGASPWQIFYKISLPQAVPGLLIAGGVAAFWASGDFALATIVSDKEIMLGQLIDTFLSSYHFEYASFGMVILLAVGLLCFLTFLGLAHVCDRKFKT